MKIRLHEIPSEGRNYIINRQTAELNAVLKDLIQDLPYELNVHIQPINSKDYQMTGTIKTKTPEQCSRCGEDFTFAVDKKIREILIQQPADDRTGRYKQHILNTDSPEAEDESALSVSHYKDNQFDLGEYIHEAIALEVPFNPAPACLENGDCSVCLKKISTKPLVYDENIGEVIKQNPFEALKSIKLN